MGTTLKGKILLPLLKERICSSGSVFFPLRAVSYGKGKHYFSIRCFALNVDNFLSHMPKCIMGATP